MTENLLCDAETETVLRRLSERFEGRSPKAKGPKGQPDAFRSLVSCLLSAQSLDRNTAKASSALFALARTPTEILALPDDALVDAIRPAGLYNVKARNLRKLCAYLIEVHGGRVPEDRKSLMAIPGIGRKCADIVLSFVFDRPVIAVDTHIHRVCNRIGLASGKTEAQTATSLEARTPDWALMDGHFWLLNFGKRICRARTPKCTICPVSDLCRTYRSSASQAATTRS